MAENRTSEFMALAKSLPGSKTGASSSLSTASGRYGSAPNSTNSQKSNGNNYAQLKDFHNTAGGISRDIAATSALLGDLTRLVRQKSLFQDDTQEINDLVVRIKGSIENLNGRLDDAGRVIAQQKNKKSQAGQEASNVVGQLKEEFGEAAAGFKKVLQQRTDVLKETTDRKLQIYGAKEETSVLSLENKPPVYGDSMMSMGMGGAGFPTLDLTSGMTAGESTSSGSQLPRPRKF
jgi:syntaxin 5